MHIYLSKLRVMHPKAIVIGGMTCMNFKMLFGRRPDFGLKKSSGS